MNEGEGPVRQGLLHSRDSSIRIMLMMERSRCCLGLNKDYQRILPGESKQAGVDWKLEE
jgi:hypothetical protein